MAFLISRQDYFITMRAIFGVEEEELAKVYVAKISLAVI